MGTKKSDVDLALANLASGVVEITDAATGAEEVMNGIADRIAAAVAAALADNPGITAEQLQGITDEGVALKAAAAKIGESIAANTTTTNTHGDGTVDANGNHVRGSDGVLVNANGDPVTVDAAGNFVGANGVALKPDGTPA